MNKYLVFVIFILLIVSCSQQQKKKVDPHDRNSPSDSVLVENFGNIQLISWFHDSIPYGCGLEFDVESDDSILIKSLRYHVTGGQAIIHASDRRFLVYIEDENVDFTSLKVTAFDSILIEKTYRIFKLEFPEFKIKSKNRMIENHISISDDSLELILKQPNENIQKIIPWDCRYGFENAKIIVFSDVTRKLLATQKSNIIHTKQLNLIENKYDSLVIELDSIFRMNFVNKKVYLDPSTETRTISIKK